MKKRKTRRYLLILGFLGLAVLLLNAGPLSTRARAVDCPAVENSIDSDKDGFTDYQECYGITMYDDSLFPGRATSGNYSRDQRLDPDTPDLFVILRPASPSNLPANPLELVSRSQAEGGLGVTVHVITDPSAPADRMVSPDSPQKAVRITEDLDPVGIILGEANQGTPNGLDNAFIYTNHIIDFIDTTCAEGSSCIDAGTGYSGQALIDLYIKHVIAHEVGHMTMLAAEYNSRFGGYHYKAGSDVIMEQAEVFTIKKGVGTFYISQHYAEPSQVGLLLK